LRLRIRDLRNLGPRSEVMLAGIGLLTADQLRARGALESYLALRRAGITGNLNMLWSLVGALDPWPEGTDWREVSAGEQRLPLLLAVESREQARDAVLEAANGSEKKKTRGKGKGAAKARSARVGAGDGEEAADGAAESMGPFGNWAPGLPFEETAAAGKGWKSKR
jgi:hypothetical protein